MSTIRFLLSYLLMFVLTLIPMVFFGDPTVSILLMVMMNAGYAVGMGPISLGWNFPLAFLATAYLTHEPILGLLFALTVTLPVLCAYVLFSKKFPFAQLLCATTAALFLPYALWEMESLRQAGFSTMQLLEEALVSVIEMVKTAGLFSAEYMPMVEEELKGMLPYMEGIVPGFYLITSFIGAYLVLNGMGRMRAQLSPEKSEEVPSFGALRLPRVLAILFIPMIVGVGMLTNQTVQIYLLNGILLVGFLAVATGFSFVDFFLSQTIRSGFMRFIIYMLVVNVTSMLVILPLGILGIVDSFFNFRRINRKNGGKCA